MTKFPIVVPGVGPIPCDFMIIGEAPGRSEIRLRQPFVGRSGELLSDALEKAGSSYEECYITNIFKGDVGEGNRNPSKEELTDHQEILLKEITEVNPRHILTLGKFATNYFFPYEPIMKNVVGKQFKEQGNKTTIYPCYHPAYVLRGRRVDIVSSFYNVIYNFINN